MKGLSTNHGVFVEEGCPRHKRDYFCPLLEGMIEFKNWLGSSGDGDEVVRRNPDEEILRLY